MSNSDYAFESKKDRILSDYFSEFHKAFLDEAHISDSAIGDVMDEIKNKYKALLKELYLEHGKDYDDKTFDTEYQKGKSKYAR